MKVDPVGGQESGPSRERPSTGPAARAVRRLTWFLQILGVSAKTGRRALVTAILRYSLVTCCSFISVAVMVLYGKKLLNEGQSLGPRHCHVAVLRSASGGGVGRDNTLIFQRASLLHCAPGPSARSG